MPANHHPWLVQGSLALVTQAEIPIGIITALLGAPLFTVLLVQSRRRSTTR